MECLGPLRRDYLEMKYLEVRKKCIEARTHTFRQMRSSYGHRASFIVKALLEG